MKRIYRSQTDKKVAGICGGLAEVYNVDPILLRGVFAFVGMATGFLPLLVTYLIGWALIPKGPAPSADLPPSPSG